MDFDSWYNLHSAIVRYREHHGLTINQFLRTVKLEELPYFQQLASKTHAQRPPSGRKESKSFEFITAIQAFFNSYPDVTDTTPIDRKVDSFADTLDNFVVDNWAHLRGLGLAGLRAAYDLPNGCFIIDKYRGRVVEDAAVLALLQRDANVVASLRGSQLVVSDHHISQPLGVGHSNAASAPPSGVLSTPTCISTGTAGSSGTLSFITYLGWALQQSMH